MITGSDNRAAHLIDEVMLDFSFDCDVIEGIHEDRLTAWAIDELLPVLESVLHANDEAGTVLRIDQITIDLGDIDDVDYFGQLIQRFREKLDLELSKIRWRRQPLDVLQQADAQIAFGPTVDIPVAQQVTRLQFNLDLLRHFLRSGNMPWHINIAESNVHERLVDHILHETHGAAALKTLLIHMASTHREPLIQRLIYQYSEAYLGKILTASLSISHDELSHWLASVRSALPKTVLTPAQRITAETRLWECCFEAAFAVPATFTAYDISARQLLRKAAVLQPHNERVKNGSMFPDVRDSGELETLAETGHDTETGQFPVQSEPLPLVHRIADDRQEAGLHHPRATPEASRSVHLISAQYDAAVAWLRKQLFEVPAGASDTLAAHELSAVIQWLLHKTSELQLHDERVQNGSMFSDERDSGKLETLAETGHDTETGQFPAQPDSIPLVHRIADDRQEAGLHHPSATPGTSRGAYLTPAQYDAAIAWLRKQLFEAPAGVPDILTAPELPAAVRQLLRKAIELQPYDENVLNGRLFQEVSRSGKPETPAVTPRDTGTGQTPAQSGMMPLFNRVVEALQKAGLLDTDLAPEKTGFTDPKDIRQRVLEILRYAMRNVQQFARLPEPVLIDMIYLLSPQMAIVLEQLSLHAEIFCRYPVRKEPANRAEWKQQLWRNVLLYCAALPDSEIVSDSPDSIRWVRSIAHHLSYDMAGDAQLQSWHTALSGRRDNIAGINTVLNMLDVSIRPAEITQHVFAAVQETRRFIAVIVQRVLSAVRRAGWAGADAISDDSDASIMNAMPTIRQQLHALFRDETVRTALTSRLSSAAMNDIVYLLSPGNAVVLEQFAQRIGTTDTQSAHARHADSEQLRRLLYSNALNILAARKIVDSNAASVEIMPAHDFMTSLVHAMSATQDDKVLAALWQESLKWVDMLPEQESARAPAVLKSLLRESGVFDVSEYPAAQAGQEIRHITAAMATDFAAQKQWLQTMFNDDKRVMAQLSVPELENLVYAMLIHNPELTGADRRTLSAAIARFAEKTRNQSVYYSRILENLLFDRLIDLESIAGQTTYAGSVDADIPESVKPPVKEELEQSVASSETYSAVIFRRVLLSLRQAGMAAVVGRLQAAPATFDVYAIRQWLTEILQVVSVRTQLIEQLPQSVLLDIVQLISPHAALYLEQVLLQTDVSGYPAAGKHRTRTGSAGWGRQIWENALRFLVTRADNDVFDARVFIQALILPLSGSTEFTAVLLKSGKDPEKENDSLQLRKKENWSTIVQYLIAEAIAAAETAQPAISASESIRPAMPVRHDVQQILAALETDFEQRRQYLKTLHDTGRLHIDQLSGGDIKAIIQALLIHNPESMGEEHEPFVTAMETYARGASNQAMYYQRILAAVLSGLDIDLEAIALNARPVQTADAPIMPVQPEDEVELLYANAGIVVLQRILSAIERLNAEAGSAESGLLLRNLQTKYLATFREQLVIGLRNPHLRTQYIAGLPQPVLLDMAFILSPAAAAMIEQVLTQSAVLQRSTAKQQDAGVEFWKLKLWEAALGFLTKLSISGSWIAGFDGAEFLQALIVELAGGEPLGAMLRYWVDALAQIPGTRVLQHLLNDLLSRRRIRRGVAGNAETGAAVSFAEAYGRSGQTSAGLPVMMDFACQPGEEFYIDNAGQVLAAPYLPRLFGLVDADVFIDRTAAERAVHLLQFMVNAKNESPEYQLLLNKILCGLTPGIPIQSRIVLSPHERDTIESLMRGMIQNWKTIGNTSISGLRETFLQRRGRLILQEEIWFLTVEPGPFDMLLDNLPWSFSVIKHRWMERAIHVTWR
ncbi:MAG: hypothetical protein KF908_10235 [Nitrosomonas sp.]|nr:hypothetical protein [Nitrosomonas sp.]